MFAVLPGNSYARMSNLLQRTGFKVRQENGQRIYYDPNADVHEQLPRGCEIFVGRLPRDLFEDELVPVFERAGAIRKMRLMMDFNGRNRGYCFVTYCSQEVANRAIELLDQHEIRPGCHVGVFKSLDNTRLFVAGIPVDKTAEEVLEAFSEFVDGIMEVIMYPSNANQDINRGYVFMEFLDHRMAAIARRRLQPGSVELWGSQILVDWAEPLPDPDPEVMAKVTKLYVRNISLRMSQEQFLNELMKYVPAVYILKVHKINDFAFVHFSTRQVAEQALRNLQGLELFGRKLDATWARPPMYSNNAMRSQNVNHFCLSIPAKLRRMMRLKHNKKQQSLPTSSSPCTPSMIMPRNNLNYVCAQPSPPQYHPMQRLPPPPMPMQMPLAMGYPNYMLPMQGQNMY